MGVYSLGRGRGEGVFEGGRGLRWEAGVGVSASGDRVSIHYYSVDRVVPLLCGQSWCGRAWRGDSRRGANRWPVEAVWDVVRGVVGLWVAGTVVELV